MSNKRSIIRFGMFIAYDKSIHHRGHRVPQGETMHFIGFRGTYYQRSLLLKESDEYNF
jgi:hypothetical protein